MDDMSAYREVFESESRDFLQLMSDALLRLEGAPNDLGPVDEVFRAAHSLKGMAAAMGYDSIANVAHQLESLVDTVRKRERAVTRELIDTLLLACDGLGDATAAATRDALDDQMLAGMADQIRIALESPAEAGAGPASATRHVVRVTLDESCALRSVRAYMVLKRLSQIGEVVETTPSMADIEDEKFDLAFEATIATACDEASIESAVLEVSEVAGVEVLAAAQPGAGEKRAFTHAPKLSDSQTVRVSVGHIDEMVNLVGELVIVRSRLGRLASTIEEPGLVRALEELGAVGSALQQVVLTTRMVPVAQIFNRFPRMVRDLAADMGRKIEFLMEGLDIELDRTVLDEIGDPLVHLLRNAVGHGVETPEEREAAGKDPTATVKLTAAREKTSVSIVVEDDGRGIDVDAVRAKAVERGIVAADRASELTEEEAYSLISSPGFSTATETTELFGRGVGLDAVKEKIEQLGGTMSISSVYGKGSKFVLALPLTLAIIQALLLEDAGNVYAVPMANVVEAHATDELVVKTIDTAPVAVLGERVVPLRPLQEALGHRPGNGEGKTKGKAKGKAALKGKGDQAVIVAWREAELGLLVEKLVGKQEVVIKPLPSWLRGARGAAGATVLGDGRVALIVDVRSLISTEVKS